MTTLRLFFEELISLTPLIFIGTTPKIKRQNCYVHKAGNQRQALIFVLEKKSPIKGRVTKLKRESSSHLQENVLILNLQPS